MLHPKAKTFLKVCLIACLFAWLLGSNKLDLSSLHIYLDRWDVGLAALMMWMIGLFLGSWRWFALLQTVGFQVSYLEAISLTLIGFFFNTVMPGSVGGDLIKAYYVQKGRGTAHGMGRVFSSIIMDRFLGFYGLFLLATLSILLSGKGLWSTPLGSYTVPFVLAAFVGSTSVVLGLFLFPEEKADALMRIARPFQLVKKVYDSFVVYRRAPMAFVQGTALSLVYQGFCFWYFAFMAEVILKQEISVPVIGLLFPTGILLSALPLAPGGLGIGHVSFDQLFQLEGITGGANVFHVVAVGQLLLNLLGVVPYLLYKRNESSGVQRSF